jgi:hypothetical protein
MYKKTNILFVFLAFLLFLFLFGCGSSEEVTVKDETTEVIEEEIPVPSLKLDIKEIYCWVDLMPGGPNRFQISGNLFVADSYKYDLKFLKLKAVRIFQDDKLIFSIIPKIKFDQNSIRDEGKEFVFSTIKGLSINPDYNMDKNVDIKIIFEENNNSFEYNIQQQKVEKVY